MKTANKTTNKLLFLILGFLILVASGYYFYSKGQVTIPAKKEETTTLGWKTYKIIPAEEEAAEPGQAVSFSIDYPATWSYKVLDSEIKKEGAGNILHFVAFSDQTPITLLTNKITIVADSHLFSNYQELVTYPPEAKKEEFSVNGKKAAKFVGKKQSPIGEAEEETVTVIIEPPADWTLVIEGKKEDELIIDQMAKSLRF